MDRAAEIITAWEALPLGAGIWVLLFGTALGAILVAVRLIKPGVSLGRKMRGREE